MPILNELGEDKKGVAVVLGCGVVHTTQAICMDAKTGLPNMANRLWLCRHAAPEGMKAGDAYLVDPATMPAPHITQHFTQLEVAGHYIDAPEIFRKSYVAKVAAITRKKKGCSCY